MPPTGSKRPHPGSNHPPRSGAGPKPHSSTSATQPAPTGPFIPMFTQFRSELDEHHDRRERIIKASRDITAGSKKIIFTLQRLRPTTLPLTGPLPPHILKEILGYETRIQDLLKSLLPDLQGIDLMRYHRQVSGGIQEYIEAIGFRHYLLHGKVISWKEAEWYVSGLNGDEILGRKKEDVEMEDAEPTETEKTEYKGIKLTKEDYVLGIFDMTGEMMRFAITSVATTPLGQLLGSATKEGGKSTPQKLLQDLRGLKMALEGLDAGGGPFGRDAEKKLQVMQECVQKVEYAFYGIVVRGSERPEGWVAEVEAGED